MPIAFFKCECGLETRKVVAMDHSQDVYDEKRRRWCFDPSKRVRTEMYPHTVTCECGQQVKQSVDPKGATTKLLFNYFED